MTDQLSQQIDDLSIKLENLTRAHERLTKRNESQEEIIRSILATMKKGEELFELRSSRVLLGIFKGLTHNLEHSIEHAEEELRFEQQGFDITVVDGSNIKESAYTILVTKTETGYDYAPANDPLNIQNEGTEKFSAYFDKYPEIFGEKTELLVNIKALVQEPIAEVPANG